MKFAVNLIMLFRKLRRKMNEKFGQIVADIYCATVYSQCCEISAEQAVEYIRGVLHTKLMRASRFHKKQIEMIYDRFMDLPFNEPDVMVEDFHLFLQGYINEIGIDIINHPKIPVYKHVDAEISLALRRPERFNVIKWMKHEEIVKRFKGWRLDDARVISGLIKSFNQDQKDDVFGSVMDERKAKIYDKKTPLQERISVAYETKRGQILEDLGGKTMEEWDAIEQETMEELDQIRNSV